MLAATTRVLRTAALWPARWPTHSQQRARRNALSASTALADRRRELLEVEEFLARHVEAHEAGPSRTPAAG